MIKIAERNTRVLSIKSDMTLNVSAIKKDTDKKKFWNKQCQDLQSRFWLPKDGNYIKAKTGTWQETCQAKSSTSIPLQIFLSKNDLPHLKPGQTVDRDHNVARNIMLRALTRSVATLGLVGNSALEHNQASLGVLN